MLPIACPTGTFSRSTPPIMAGPNGHMVGDLPVNRIVTHLHGGLTPWFSDGTPFQWYTRTGSTGRVS